MIKLIVSDLDETLIGPNGYISEENVKTIKAVTQMGVKFVPNTGRGYQSVQALLETLGLRNQPNEYVISYNGGAIVENKNLKVIQTQAMSFEQASQIFDVVKNRPEYGVHIYTLDKVYIYNPIPNDIEYIKSRGVEYELYDNDDLKALADQPIIKIITMNLDFKKRQEIKAAVLARVDFDINATYSSERYTEFNLGGVDKGKAALALGDILGIKKEEIMALGDNNNDLAMLAKVGLPIAVANANADAKKLAQYVTKNDYHTGVAEALRKFILEA